MSKPDMLLGRHTLSGIGSCPEALGRGDISQMIKREPLGGYERVVDDCLTKHLMTLTMPDFRWPLYLRHSTSHVAPAMCLSKPRDDHV